MFLRGRPKPEITSNYQSVPVASLCHEPLSRGVLAQLHPAKENHSIITENYQAILKVQSIASLGAGRRPKLTPSP